MVRNCQRSVVFLELTIDKSGPFWMTAKLEIVYQNGIEGERIIREFNNANIDYILKDVPKTGIVYFAIQSCNIINNSSVVLKRIFIKLSLKAIRDKIFKYFM